MAGYVYVWQEAMLRNAKIGTGLCERFEPPIIVRTRDKVYGVKIAGPSEIVYTPPALKPATRSVFLGGLWAEFDVEMDRLYVIMNEGKEPDLGD
jgi:hypothetical protein